MNSCEMSISFRSRKIITLSLFQRVETYETDLDGGNCLNFADSCKALSLISKACTFEIVASCSILHRIKNAYIATKLSFQVPFADRYYQLTIVSIQRNYIFINSMNISRLFFKKLYAQWHPEPFHPLMATMTT